jgi:dienelactone hydrolase
MRVRPSTIAAVLFALPAAAMAQTSPPVMAPGVIGAPQGTGRNPAVAESRAESLGYTFYHPAKMPAKPIPLVLWGNGGCKDNGLSASHFLREIASHGYFVIANGAPRMERPIVSAVPPANGRASANSPPIVAPDETSVAQLLGAIDWAKAANRTGPLAGHIDIARVGVMGHSCGGLQAISAGADPRVSAIVIYDSGIYNVPHDVPGRLHMDKSDLLRLHTPVAYFLGGPTDIAYPNGSDDVARIQHVPVFYANLPVGHGGTFQLANGGDWARAGAAWLDWQLKRIPNAGRLFVGPSCGLCTDKRWTIVRKQFPEAP